jgi:general secretion pathway protein H
MRSFAALRTPARRAGGFTLLEIMVVAMIIGVLASFAVLSIGSRALDDRMETEARRLQELLTLAADEAVLQGAELGFIQTTDGYAFLALKDGQWLPLDDVGALRARPLAEPFFLRLRVEGRPVKPVPEDVEPQELKPQVLLLSSGETTEFSLDLRAQDYGPHYVLEGDALGRLKLQRKDGAS